MKKVCVFCGKPPNNKNKEHIIPQWLMSLTGTKNKNISVGSNWKTGKEIVFNFSSFTFPSCTSCNSEFGKLEGKIKPIIEGILENDYVGTEDLILLLDWFDKVRVSLWLGIQYLNKGAFNFTPKYYINQRLGLKDRLLSISNCNDGYKGLKWTGANSLTFIMSPTAFTLKINHVIFTNCSSDFVISEQLGFPYPLYEQVNPQSELTNLKLSVGKNKVSRRLFQSRLYEPNTIICQPKFQVGLASQPLFYDVPYVRENSYKQKLGQGKIFVAHDNLIYPMELDEEIRFTNEQKEHKYLHKLNRPTLEFQLELLTNRKIKLDLLNSEQKKQHSESLKMIIQYTKEQIKQYDY